MNCYFESLDYPWEAPSFFIFHYNLASFISIIYDLYQNIQQNEMYNNRCNCQRKEQTKWDYIFAYKNWFNQCFYCYNINHKFVLNCCNE